MALQLNANAPDFTLPSTDDKTFTLSKDAAGESIIIYFYPRDFTPGCTKEACGFRNNFETFKASNIKIVGISTDPIEVHEAFKNRHDLPFDLLSDIKGNVSKKYKAKVPFLSISKRITYFLDKDHKITAVYTDLFGAEKHIKQMLDIRG